MTQTVRHRAAHANTQTDRSPTNASKWDRDGRARRCTWDLSHHRTHRRAPNSKTTTHEILRTSVGTVNTMVVMPWLAIRPAMYSGSMCPLGFAITSLAPRVNGGITCRMCASKLIVLLNMNTSSRSAQRNVEKAKQSNGYETKKQPAYDSSKAAPSPKELIPAALTIQPPQSVERTAPPPSLQTKAKNKNNNKPQSPNQAGNQLPRKQSKKTSPAPKRAERKQNKSKQTQHKATANKKRSKQRRSRSYPPTPWSSTSHGIRSATPRWGTRTPFGRPVEPLVKMM